MFIEQPVHSVQCFKPTPNQVSLSNLPDPDGQGGSGPDSGPDISNPV